MWRHDTALTAYQPVPGAMTKEPQIVAKRFIGTGHGALTFADLLGTGKDTEVLVLARGRLHAYAKSGKKNLLDWNLLPNECVYTKKRYSACPALRFLDGWFYMTYLEARPGPNYETYLVRSRDLIRWESSPLNPVLKASPENKLIANPKLTANQRAKITRAADLNNSDVDLCEFRGKTIITYSWGNQQGTEFLAEAVSDGTLASFLKGFFP